MTTLNGPGDLREAVGALDHGRAHIVDVERSIRNALSKGVVTRGDAFLALQGIVDQSAAAEIIERLQLRSGDTWERIASLRAERAAAATQAPKTATRILVPTPASGAGPLRSGNETEIPETDRRWVEPDPFAALLIDGTMIGQLLGGRYRLDREIQRDVMGTAYLACDLKANATPLVVTVLRPEFRSLSETLMLLRAEVRVTRMLRHSHIARVYSLNSDGREIYLVTEFFEGRTLEEHLREFCTGLPLNEARTLLHDMCAALDYAHDLEVVHGDLKPANVFITSSGRVKLLNFGLARAARTRNGRFDALRVGGLTTAYSSPQMLEGGEADPRDDVYSLACIIYTILSGVHPFGSRSGIEARDLALPVPRLSILQSGQNAALAKALAFERAERTSSVMALFADLGGRSAAGPQPVSEPAMADPATPVSLGSTELLAPSILMTMVPALADSAAPEHPATEEESAPVRADGKARRHWRPLLIVVALAAAVGAGIAVEYRTNTAVVIRPRTRSNPSSATSPPSELSSAPAGPHITSNAETPVSSSAAPVFQPATTAPASEAKSVVPPATVAPPSSLMRPLPKAAVAMADNDNCPYPREAVDQGLTGTVFLMVFVATDGRPARTKLDKSSGSSVLDQAAIDCVEKFGRFAGPPAGSDAGGYWGRMRFKWSFGI